MILFERGYIYGRHIVIELDIGSWIAGIYVNSHSFWLHLLLLSIRIQFGPYVIVGDLDESKLGEHDEASL